MSRAQASGSVSDLNVYKLGVAMCRQITNTFDGCTSGTGDVPTATDTEFLTGLAIGNLGVITANSSCYLGRQCCLNDIANAQL